jgi:guanylate kinase
MQGRAEFHLVSGDQFNDIVDLDELIEWLTRGEDYWKMELDLDEQVENQAGVQRIAYLMPRGVSHVIFHETQIEKKRKRR